MNREKKPFKKTGLLFLLVIFCVHGVNTIKAADASSVLPKDLASPTPVPVVESKTPAPAPVEQEPQASPTPIPEELETPTVQEDTSEDDEVVPSPTPVPVAEPESPISSTPVPAKTEDDEQAPMPTPEPTPPPVEPEPSPTPTPEKPKPVSGIDTIDIEDGGNWLLKRKALEDTVNVIEEINVMFTKILQASTDFKVKRNKLDSEYDLFVATIGFNLGDFDQLLTSLLDDLEEEREHIGDLSVDEREAVQTINEKKNEIKQLQEDLKALTDLDDELDTVINTVDNQIKTANNYQNQAWKNFQTIKKVLSDEKADELYYQTEGLYKSMQEIYSYLIQKLSTYFSGQMQVMRDQMNTIKSTIQSLQQKGVDLQKNIDQLEQQDEQLEQQRLEQQKEEEIRRAVIEAEMARKKVSWFQRVKRVILYPFCLLKSLWYTSAEWVRGLMGKKPQATEQPENVKQSKTAEQPEVVEQSAQTSEDETGQEAVNSEVS